MKKLQTFFHALFHSVTSPSYYHDVTKARFSFSLKYLLFFYLFVVAISLAPLFQMLFVFDAGKAILQVGTVYPADLTMTIANGQFFINKPLPYTIPMPQDLRENTKEGMPTNLVVFEKDTAIHSIADVRTYHAFAVVTETSFYMLKDTTTGEIRAYPIPRTEHAITISRSVVNSALTRIAEYPLIKSRLYAPVLTLLLFLVAYPLAVAGALISLLFISLFPFFLAKLFLKHQSVSYGTTYQIGMHAQTALILLNLVALRLAGREVLSGLLFTLVCTLVIFVLISQLPTAAARTHRKSSKR